MEQQVGAIPSTYSIQSPRRMLEEDARGLELIDQDTKWWNSIDKRYFSGR